jgi:hypothetical protein
MSLDWQTVDSVLTKTAHAPKYLIDGLVHATATMVIGDPKAGKSFLTVSLAHALASGQATWLGRAVNGGPHRVAFLLTDVGAQAETADRLAALGGAPDVLLASWSTDAVWADEAERLAQENVSVVIVDNLMGTLPAGAEVNSQKDCATTLEGLKQFVARGMAVIVVHHTPKAGQGGLGKGKSPMGSTYITAWARHLLRLERQGAARTLAAWGNHTAGESLRLDMSVEDGAVAFSVAEKVPERRLARGTASRAAARTSFAKWFLTTPAASMRQADAARWLEANPPGEVTKKASAWKTYLSRSAEYLVSDGSGWKLGPALKP